MRKELFLVLLGVIAGLVAGFVGVGAGEPGDVTDPLVSESYVREMSGFNQLELAPGRDLALRGGSEVLVTSGDLSVKSAVSAVVIDVTEGTQLTDLDPLPRTHLLLVLSTTEEDVILASSGGATVYKRGF
jgi:hypothetical protein